MANLQGLQTKFQCVKHYQNESVTINWYKPNPQSKGVLFTKGLSRKDQHQLAGKSDNIHQHIELYFLLPIHWDINKDDQRWPIEVLERLILAQVRNNAWFGPGDTLTAHPKGLLDAEIIDDSLDNQNNQLPVPINTVFKQNHFILADPIEAYFLLEEINDDDSNWLGIIPIYQEEFDYKTSRSATELMISFERSKLTELVDEHRKPVIKRRFFGLFWGRRR